MDIEDEEQKKQVDELEIHFQADFRLLEVSLEMSALEDHLELIENQIATLGRLERIALDDFIKSQHPSPDGFERAEAYYGYYHKVDALLPRLFRGPFIVSLYAAYETAVTEIARLIQETLAHPLSLNDIRAGTFLERASKYYRHVLNFELCRDNIGWQYITMLSAFRNAIAHTNGRWDMLNDSTKHRIEQWKKERAGVEIVEGYIVVDSAFLKKTFGHVRDALTDLIDRYKQWDDSKNP